jgi:23S rRNA pseudouridine2604 synthase
MSDQSGTRINKYLSKIGYCSRRAADKLIEAGRVTLNDAPVVMGSKIKPGDLIKVDGKPLENTGKNPFILPFINPLVLCAQPIPG